MKEKVIPFVKGARMGLIFEVGPSNRPIVNLLLTLTGKMILIIEFRHALE
jgi:hypothetical protein